MFIMVVGNFDNIFQEIFGIMTSYERDLIKNRKTAITGALLYITA